MMGMKENAKENYAWELAERIESGIWNRSIGQGGTNVMAQPNNHLGCESVYVESGKSIGKFN